MNIQIFHMRPVMDQIKPHTELTLDHKSHVRQKCTGVFQTFSPPSTPETGLVFILAEWMVSDVTTVR